MANKKNKSKFDAVLFDIDGVLIDVRRSYLEAIRCTVQIYLEKVLSFKPLRGSLLTLQDVESFKRFGGLNNDWDCTFAIILYLLSIWDGNASLTKIRQQKKIQNLRASSQQMKHILKFVRMAKSRQHPTYLLAQRIFQELYLGKPLFKKRYRLPTIYNQKKGLIHREALICSQGKLQQLRQRHIQLGIVTGRNAFEAKFILKKHRILRLFSTVITQDDVERAEKKHVKKMGKHVHLGKPHPFALEQAIQKIGKKKAFAYVGDLPDDIQMAKKLQRKTRIKAVGYAGGSTDPEQLRKQQLKEKADYTFTTTDALFRLLLAQE